MQNELRLETVKNIGKLGAVHLNMNGADGRTVGERTEIDDKMLDGIVGEERHPVVRSDAAAVQDRGDASGQLAQLPISDYAPVVGANDPCLVRIASRSCGDPIAQEFGAHFDLHGMIVADLEDAMRN